MQRTTTATTKTRTAASETRGAVRVRSLSHRIEQPQHATMVRASSTPSKHEIEHKVSISMWRASDRNTDNTQSAR